MWSRRALLIAAAVGLHALAALGLGNLAQHSHSSHQKPPPVVVQLIVPPTPVPPPAAPAPRAVMPPAPPAAVKPRPVPATSPAPNPTPAQSAAHAPRPMDQTVSPTPARTVPDSAPATSAPQLPAVALPAPVAPAAAPAAAAPSAAATAPPALASNIGPSARSTPESGTVTGAAQPAAPAAPAAPRRVGPRVDASWAGNAAPAYPLSAKRMGEQGTVRLDVHVGADGGVLEVQVRQSSGSAALDRAASEGVRKWRFRPATVDGQPVAEWYRNWEWVFKLEG